MEPFFFFKLNNICTCVLKWLMCVICFSSQSPIPEELLQKLIKSRVANAGVFNLRQITLATFDQNIHTRERVTTFFFICLDLPIRLFPAFSLSHSFFHSLSLFPPRSVLLIEVKELLKYKR